MVTRAVVAALAVAACTETVQVLAPGDDARPTTDAGPVITTCEQALQSDAGQRCAPDLTCADPVSTCCTQVATCVDGVLATELQCECTDCTADDGCAAGAQICQDLACVDCPIADTCTACPEGLVWLERNGCTTCTCAPPSQCDATGACEAGTCIRGARCSDGCPDDDFGCCASVCTTNPECPAPAPQGCDVACDLDHQACGNCVTIDCTCTGDTWTCGQTCAYDLEPTCTFS